MTERLYYTDSFLREFDAQALGCESTGDRWQVLLDRTAFYPATGGQPHDTGWLGEAAVVEVIERGDEVIAHVVDQPLAPGKVHGSIDWERRFDHMQQHTCQHLLSAVFLQLFQFPTVSFHLGRGVCTIDLEARSVVPRHLQEAEWRANEIIFEDRPVQVSFQTMQELAEAGIRKGVKREGVLRVIEVEDFDRQPCGGTHLARTGQGGLLLVRNCEKQRQNWRVEFVAGFRALAAGRADFAALDGLARELSCGLLDVPEIVRKALGERRAAVRLSKRLSERLAELEAKSLVASKGREPGHGSPCVVTAVFEDADAAYLGLLAAKMVATPGVQALLASRASGAIVFAQSAGIGADMAELLRGILLPAGGKGGGNKQFAQGSLPHGSSIEAILTAAAERLPRSG